MSKRTGIALSDLPSAARAQATRQISHALAVQNGPGIPQPTQGKEVKPCDAIQVSRTLTKPQSKAPPTSHPAAALITWFRTNDLTPWIEPVEVLRVGKDTLQLIGGAVDEKHSPCWDYHETKLDAARHLLNAFAERRNLTLKQYAELEAYLASEGIIL